MVGITSEMCLTAAKKVFGTIPDIKEVAQGMIESGMSRVDTSHRIDMNQVPESVLRQMAESAGWYISDHNLRNRPKGEGVNEIREQIADFLVGRFPVVKQYVRQD